MSLHMHTWQAHHTIIYVVVVWLADDWLYRLHFRCNQDIVTVYKQEKPTGL